MLWGGRDDSLTVQMSGTRVAPSTRGTKRLRLILRDVTEEKRLERRLTQAQKMETVGQLAGGIAHDFNNLLMVIRHALEFAEEALGEPESLRQELEQIGEAADRAAELTGHLLAFSGRQSIQPVPTELNRLVQRTEQMLRRVIREEIELAMLLCDAPTTVNVDPTQLQQVLVNLAVNARDAMEGVGRLVFTTEVVELSGVGRVDLPSGHYVRLQVRDTGQGMSDDVRAHAFEPFFTTKPAGKGTGLGLATCYGIVKQAGGEIIIDSEVGAYTSFDIYLPLHAADAVSGASAESDGDPTGAGGGEQLLVVEDDPRVRSIMKRTLEAAGYRVTAAPNGEEALARAQELEIDLVVTDVIMPHLGGVPMATRMRERRPELRVVFMSGYLDEETKASQGAARHTAFLQKPFLAKRLLDAVRSLLDA